MSAGVSRSRASGPRAAPGLRVHFAVIAPHFGEVRRQEEILGSSDPGLSIANRQLFGVAANALVGMA